LTSQIPKATKARAVISAALTRSPRHNALGGTVGVSNNPIGMNISDQQQGLKQIVNPLAAQG
jgi:hypothetical protein